MQKSNFQCRRQYCIPRKNQKRVLNLGGIFFIFETMQFFKGLVLALTVIVPVQCRERLREQVRKTYRRYHLNICLFHTAVCLSVCTHMHVALYYLAGMQSPNDPPSRFGHIKVKSTFGPQFLQGLAREKGLIKVDSLTFQKGDYIPAFLSISILTPHKSCMLIPPMRNQAGWTFVCTEDPGINGSIDIRYGIDPHGDPRVGGCL